MPRNCLGSQSGLLTSLSSQRTLLCSRVATTAEDNSLLAEAPEATSGGSPVPKSQLHTFSLQELGSPKLL